MKKLPLLLGASLLANAVLLAVFMTKAPPAPAESPASTARRPARTASPGPAAASSLSLAAPAAAPATGPIVTQEARDLIARMRAAGFPEETIRVAAQARLSEQYSARYAEIMGVNKPLPPFWSSEASASGILMDPARQAAQRELSREMTAALRDLFGADFAALGMSEEARVAMQRQYGNLSPEKIIQLQQVMQDFSMRQQEVNPPAVGGYMIRLPEDTAKLAQIEQERRAAIVALLSPQELEEYDLRASTSASQLKSQLVAFEPTEAEYRALFKIQQAFDEKYPSSAMMGAPIELMRERSLAQQNLKTEMAAVLPPDRAEAYLLATENGATSVARIISRLEMPMSTVGQVMTIQKEIQAQANALRMDRTLTPDVRNQALAALQQQANERIAGRIGANGLAAYRSSAGSWIQNLVPPPPISRGGAPAPIAR